MTAKVMGKSLGAHFYGPLCIRNYNSGMILQ